MVRARGLCPTCPVTPAAASVLSGSGRFVTASVVLFMANSLNQRLIDWPWCVSV